MKQKKLMAIAVGCGLACALCVAAFMANVQGEANAARAEALARYGGEQVEVCVAARDIAAGERLDLSSVETRLWVADLLPEDAVRESGSVIGQVATSSILKGEVVSAKRFESERDALDVPVGMEAVSVPAKPVLAVGGAVRPGMRVDVYSSGDTTTTVIAQGVPVLATSVGDSGSLVSSDSGWITLAVEPAKVQELIAASHATTLYFVLPGEGLELGELAAGQEDALAADEPAVDALSAGEPVAGEPVADEPAAEGREADEPTADGFAAGESPEGEGGEAR